MTAKSKIARSPPTGHPFRLGFLGASMTMCALGIPAYVTGVMLPGRPIGVLVCLAGAGSVVMGSLTAFGASRFRRELSRGQGGMCIRCGYSLRASPDRCPECGRRIRRKVPAAW